MKPDDEKPGRIPLSDAILSLIIGGLLTYFFFEPGKEAISSFVKTLLPTGW